MKGLKCAKTNLYMEHLKREAVTGEWRKLHTLKHLSA
jgi:hypothetical protein